MAIMYVNVHYFIFYSDLAGWLSWLKHHPMHQKFVGSIPGQGTFPRLWVQSPVGACMRGNQSVLLSYVHVSLSLPPLSKSQ